MFGLFGSTLDTSEKIAIAIVVVIVLVLLQRLADPRRSAREEAEVAGLKALKEQHEAVAEAAKQKQRFAAKDVPLDILNQAELERLQAEIQMRLSKSEYDQKTAFDEEQALARAKWAREKLAVELEMDKMRTKHAEQKARRRRQTEEADTE